MTLDQENLGATFAADPSERLLAPAERRARDPFPLLLLICFLAHAAILTLLLFQDYFQSPAATAAEEIPVEIVAEMPPEPAVKPLPPPPDLVTPPAVKPETPPEEVQLDDVKVAYDAPVSGNASQTQKSDTEKETRAPQMAPPPKLAAPEPPQKKPEQERAAAPPNEKSAEDSPSPDAQKLPDDQPDAEALEKAQPPAPKLKEKKAPKPSKDTAAEGRKITVAQQLAALAPAPNFSFGAKAKAAPIGGGTEKASYESLLMGMISRQLKLPARASHLLHSGDIGLFVDELGNLTHQALYHASGDPALDAAWLAAVRRAAPFPAPPRGLPHGFLLHFTDRE